MPNLDINELREKLLEIYRQFIQGEDLGSLKSEAYHLYRKFSDASIVLDKTTANALNSLIFLFGETGGIRVSRDEPEKILVM